jgi:hypothetical protein
MSHGLSMNRGVPMFAALSRHPGVFNNRASQ